MASSGEEGEWDTDAKVAALREAVSDAQLPSIYTNSASLARFLRARKGVVEDAKKMLLRHVQWRREQTPWYPEHTVDPKEVETLLRGGSSYIRGVDKSGRPTTVVRVRFHVAATERPVLYRFVALQLDELVARSDVGDHASRQFSVILDASGLSWSSFDTDVLKYILKMLSGNYPERLGRLCIVNEGFLFRTLWRVIEPFLDARTSAKIFFMGGEDAHPAKLQEFWAADQLPVFLGGTDAYEYKAEEVLATPSSYVSVREGFNHHPRGIHATSHGHHTGPHAAHGHHHGGGAPAGGAGPSAHA